MAKPFKNYYEVLEVPRTASDDDIKSAFRRLRRKTHTDIPRNDDGTDYEERSKVIGEAYEALGAGGIRPENRRKYDEEYDQHIEQEQKAQGILEIKLPVNDLGLLAALRMAYQSTEPGKWYISKSQDDTRDWMPKNVYQVERDEKGNVTIYRTVKDWRLPSQRDEPLKLTQEDNPYAIDDTPHKPDARVPELMLYGEGNRHVIGLYGGSGKYKEYLEAIKGIARTLATPAVDGKYQLNGLDTIKHYVEGTIMVTVDNEHAYNPDAERGRVIPLNNFVSEVRRAEDLVHFKPSQGKEGQQVAGPEGRPASGPEGNPAEMGGGEAKG